MEPEWCLGLIRTICVLILVLMEYKWNSTIGTIMGVNMSVLILVLMEYKWNTCLLAPFFTSCDVLILVLMEYKWNVYLRYFMAEKDVLILVLMEYKWNKNIEVQNPDYELCLNPCFNGIQMEQNE